MPVATPGDPSTAIEGRVLDEAGAPVGGAVVHVLADEDPCPDDDPAPRIGWNAYRGRTFTSAVDGCFRAALPAPARVLVVLGIEPFYEAVDERSREVWVDAPASGLEFRVRRVPTATLVLRARRAGAREALRDFQVELKGEEVGYSTGRAHGESLTWVLPVRDPEGVAIELRLLSPECDPAPRAELVLKAGEEREHLFLLEAGTRVAGHVVDERGVPIEGVTVYFGDAATARGDEPFRAFSARRLSDAVITAPDGFFELDGTGDQLTAWHADHSPSTVDRSDASRIVLAPRGAIAGRVLDAAGQPLAGAPLQLDDPEESPVVPTDAEGRFRFEALEAGAHGIWQGRELLAGVRLEAGQTVELELRLRAAGSLELDLVRDGAPAELDELEGAIVGLDPVFEFHEIEWNRAADPRPATEGPVRPGRYRLLAARVPCAIGPAGELTLLLPAGSHVVVGEAGRELARVELPQEGASITLP